MPVPYSFGAATSAIPLSQLDANFNTPITLGNTAIQLGNTVTTLNNMTLANVTISSGNVTITNVTVTTANATTVNTTTLIATTANVTTGNVTNLISGNVSLTGGSITGTPISGSTGSFTTLTTSSTVTLNGGTANGVAYLNGSKVLTTGSALTFDGTKLGVGVASAQAGVDIANSGSWSSGNIYNYPAGNAFVKIQGVAAQSNWIGIVGSYGQTTGSANLLLQANFNNTTQQAGHYIGSEAQSATSSDLTFGSITGGVTTGTNATKNELMRLTSTGLGIGTSSPGAKLEVLQSQNGATRIRVNNQNTGASAVAGIDIQAYGGGWTIDVPQSATFVNPLQFIFGGSEKMRLDSSGNLGLGVTPSAWASGWTALQIKSGGASIWTDGGARTFWSNNEYFDGTNRKYVVNGRAHEFAMDSDGSYAWKIAASGTAGNAITFTQAMTLDASGNLGIGTSSPSTKLHVTGSIRSGVDGSDSVTAGANVQLVNAAGSRGSILQLNAANGLAFWSNGAGSWAQTMTLDSSGNLLLNGTTAGASSVGTFAIFNGTAPTGSVTNGIILYAEDVSSSSELKVRDEAGNVTTLSPHNFSLIPEGPSEDMAWAYYSEKGGKRINVDMLKLARMVEKLTGEKLVYED